MNLQDQTLELRPELIRLAKQRFGAVELMNPAKSYFTDFRSVKDGRMSIWKEKKGLNTFYRIDYINKQMTIQTEISQTELLTIN